MTSFCLMNRRWARKNWRMKSFASIWLVVALDLSAFAQITNTRAALELKKNDGADTRKPVLTFPVTAAVVSAPFVLTNGYISQPEQLDIADSGKAVYNFTITNSGNYMVEALVNATGEDANSFYVNVDGQPEDPAMVWDIEVTSGFEARTVSWRGDGPADNDQFAPKPFKLTAGAHKLIIVGREADTELKTVFLYPAPAE
jgi:hypothetical protein